ncbi:MAG: DUF3244 domain-containing protein [Bacilli bacterium]
MKTLKKILLCLLLLIPLNVIAGKEIKIKETYPTIGPRTSVPSVDATLYSDYILLDINRYYGSVVVEVENEESGEVASSEYFVNSRDSFTFDIPDMPVGAYSIRIRFSNGVEYYGQFTIDILLP